MLKLDRRQLFAATGGMLAVKSLPNIFSFSEQEQKQLDEEKQLKFLTQNPRNGEPALNDLVHSWITPTEKFYVRSHAPNPVIDCDQFRLTIEGQVKNPTSLSLQELSGFARHRCIATMTCAGNRRIEFNQEKKVGGVQWGPGAIGNAQWQGCCLADVLKHVGLLEGARHVWFEGLDQIQRRDGIIPFGASIPIEKAMLDNGGGRVLLCDQMNEQDLTPDHGFPLRAVVPGYIGARSVKWLGKIVVSDRPSPNHYVASAYKIVRDQSAMDWNEAGPIYRFPINAAATVLPTGNEGQWKVSGYALPTGVVGRRIRKVQVSSDSGNTWIDAELNQRQEDFCWCLWSADITVPAPSKQIVVRAFDTGGGFMPQRVPWNAKGYLQNSWFRANLKKHG